MSDLVYILAASHSGSTLLAMLLNAHRDVCSVGELKATNIDPIEQYRCSCRRLILECPFWQSVRSRLVRSGIDLDLARPQTDVRACESAYARRLLAPLHRGPVLEACRDAALSISPEWRAHRRESDRRNAALVEAIGELAGAKVVVDSSKVALRLKYLLRNESLNVKVIHLVRDGRGVALAYMDPSQYADARDASLRGGGTGRNAEQPRQDVGEAAAEWRRCNEEAHHALATLDSSRWIRVRYEDICRDPQATLGRLFSFIGVDGDCGGLDFRGCEHHVLGNGMRLDSDSEIRLDERWRERLSDTQLHDFERIAGAMNRQYGYSG